MLVLLAGLAPISPLQDAATGATVDVLVKTKPVMWVLFAPLFGVWDTLSLLTLSQHYAVLVTFVAVGHKFSPVTLCGYRRVLVTFVAVGHKFFASHPVWLSACAGHISWLSGTDACTNL